MGKRILVGICYALLMACIPFLWISFYKYTPGPELVLPWCGILAIIGFIAGYYDRIRRERKDEQEREQEETNHLMQEYLKKKLAEEDNE